MRNLVTLNQGSIPFASQTAPDLPLLQSVFDPINDAITLVLGPGEYQVIEVQQFQRNGQVKLLASFPLSEPDVPLLSFAHFSDSQQLVFIFGNGDLILANYQPDAEDAEETVVEVVGSIDAGIKAAQWSHDEETLVIVTAENSVILLSRQFDSIGELKLLEKDSELSNHVDVGWGSKETQFRGKGARQAERDLIKNLDLERDMNKRDPTMPLYVDDGRLSEFDTKEVVISWRADCENFAISTIDVINEIERRIIRVFTRAGELTNVTEPVDGLENQLSWGTLITSVQRKLITSDMEALEVVFFEKNGLRHGQFDSRLNPHTETIDLVLWNANNEILTTQSEKNTICIWTTKNYHWYLKQEIQTATPIEFIKWHPEKNLTLMVGTAEKLEIIDFGYKTTTGPSVIPLDVGMNLVVDGSTVNITPLALANVPPPMAWREIEVEENVLDVAVSYGNDKYAVLTNEKVYLCEKDLALMKKGQSPAVVSKLQRLEFASDEEIPRQITFRSDNLVAVLLDNFTTNQSRVVMIDVTDLCDPFVRNVVESPMKVVLLKNLASWDKISVQTVDGSVYVIEEQFNAEIEDFEYSLQKATKFPQLCYDYELVNLANSDAAASPDDEYEQPNVAWAGEEEDDKEQKKQTSNYTAFGLTSTGKLFANELQLSTGISSLKVTESHLIVTTAQHTLRFIHLESYGFKPLSDSTDVLNDERIREIERGSLLVNVIPSKAAVVLQAPRGNLETINPRILILATVRKDIKNKNYRAAFVTCRTHRIDLDILHDYDPELFHSNVELFVKQIERIDYLDLFVSCLHEEDVTKTKYVETRSDEETDALVQQHQAQAQAQSQQKYTPKNKNWVDPKDSKVNKICEAILQVLLTEPYHDKYLQTIITAYACEKPANLEAALTLISNLTDKPAKEKSVVHLCFLQDVNLLYKVALGLYDIKLTLAIAQQSQKDPKEYLPFLQNLFDQTELRRRFLIDDFLGKFEKALSHLSELVVSESEGEITQELKDYVVKHDLYKSALKIYKSDNSKQNAILQLFAHNLYSKQSYAEAGLTHELLKNYKDALECYTAGQRWREALAIVTKIPEHSEELQDICERLIQALTENHKYSDAARIQFRYLNDIEKSLKLYCKEYQYEEAILLATSEKRPELIEEIIVPGLGEGFGTIAELIADCKGQITSQLRRLRELRTKKTEDPYAFFGQVEETADDVSIAPSETSTKESFFTRYTGKTSGTAKTGASRRTIKNKKREERKRARGKKGTIYEEEYLIKSIGRLIERLNHTKLEALRLIEGLLRLDKREQAHQIQKQFVELVAELKENIDEVFNISEKDRERVDEYGEVYYIPEIATPVVEEFPKLEVLDY